MATASDRASGFQSAPNSTQEPSLLQEFMPFLPDVVDDAVPLYVLIGLLFVGVSRAARRRTRYRPHVDPKPEEVQRVATPQGQLGTDPRYRIYGGYWGDGEAARNRD